jgi:hypothetical protein
MDLFEQLGMSIGGQSVADHMDSLRATNDTRAIEAQQDDLHDPELKDYGVTVELTLASYSEKEAVLLAQSLLERANKLSKVVYDIERVIEL